MSEESEPNLKTGWCKLYHRSGALVTLPIPADVALDYKRIHANVEAALAAGFVVTAPGLEPGEQKLDVGYVVRRSKKNNDQTVTPIIDLYSTNDALKHPVLTVYLNRDDDTRAFESLSGRSLNSIPKYIGANKIERGNDDDTDQLVVKLAKPITAIWIDNPKYDAKEAEASKSKGEPYTVAKRKFLRWDGAPAPAEKVNTESTAVDQVVLNEWKNAVKRNNSLAWFTKARLSVLEIRDKWTQRAVWNVVRDAASAEGFDFDDRINQFVAPVDTDDAGRSTEIPF